MFPSHDQITWSGTITYDANGAKGASAAFGNTNLIPSSVFSSDNTSIFYCMENTTASFQIGCKVSNSQEMIAEKNGIVSLSSHQYTNFSGGNGIMEVILNSNSSAVVMSKLSTDHTIAVNGNIYNSTTRNGGTLPSVPLYVMAINNNSVTQLNNTLYHKMVGFTNGINKSRCAQFRSDLFYAERLIGRI